MEQGAKSCRSRDDLSPKKQNRHARVLVALKRHKAYNARIKDAHTYVPLFQSTLDIEFESPAPSKAIAPLYKIMPIHLLERIEPVSGHCPQHPAHSCKLKPQCN